MRAIVRTVYEIHHHYDDGSSRMTTVRLSDDATAIYVQPENENWFGLYGVPEAHSVADAIKKLADDMDSEATDG